MPLENWSENVIVVHLTEDPQFTDDLSNLFEQIGERKTCDVVLSFSGVNYLNSSNIAKLLKLRKQIAIVGNRKLMLCDINNHVWGVFLVTGLDKVFDFAESVPLALATIQIDKQNKS